MSNESIENLGLGGAEGLKCPFCQEPMAMQLGFFGDEFYQCGTCGCQMSKEAGRKNEIVTYPMCPRCLTKVRPVYADGKIGFACKCDGQPEDEIKLG